jgi:hypothetical protein
MLSYDFNLSKNQKIWDDRQRGVFSTHRGEEREQERGQRTSYISYDSWAQINVLEFEQWRELCKLTNTRNLKFVHWTIAADKTIQSLFKLFYNHFVVLNTYGDWLSFLKSFTESRDKSRKLTIKPTYQQNGERGCWVANELDATE